MTSPSIALFIDPVSHHYEGDALFNEGGNSRVGDHIFAPFAYVKQWFEARGVSVHTGDLLEQGVHTADLNMYTSLGLRDRWPRLANRGDVVLSAFFANDCPIAEPSLYRHLRTAATSFRRVYSFSDSESIRPFIGAPIDVHSYKIAQSFDDVHENQWSRTDRRFLTMINANKLPRLSFRELYTERLRAVEHFARAGDFDLYGNGWDKAPVHLGVTWVPWTIRRRGDTVRNAWSSVHPGPYLAACRDAWKGSTPSKSETLGGYRFALAFENMILRGWITEKLFDCLFTGTVPIYFGAPDIAEHVPRDCFIDMRDFESYPALEDRLRSMSDAEWVAMRDAGRDFVRSDRFRPFSKLAFAELFATIVEEDAGVAFTR